MVYGSKWTAQSLEKKGNGQLRNDQLITLNVSLAVYFASVVVVFSTH
jgi:hypothetical protein